MRRGKVLATALAVALNLLPLPALACGGLFCQNTPVDQAGEKILFAADGQNVTAHVQIQYTGAAKDFSWIVPVPTKPTLGVGTDNLFTALRAATRPQFNLTMRDEDGCEPPPYDKAQEGIYPSLPEAVASTAVTVVSQAQVGPYDSAILTADDPGALKAWLKANHYVIPAKIDPLLDPYVAGKYFFVALKLTKDKDAGDIQPIVLKYTSTKPGIPIRLTGVAANPDMDVFVWVLGKQRAIPENYRHAIINEARIDWLNGGANYPQVVTDAMNDAGGQAFVTDYAGDSAAVGAQTFGEGHFRLDALGTLREPVAFAQEVVDQGYFGEAATGIDGTALVAFLKRYIARPATVQGVSDTDFYRFLSNYQDQLQAAQVSVDTVTAMAELREKVVKPYTEIGKLFQASPYLTAMYTTMSPEEMTQDPMFVFAQGLAPVANVHEATGVRRCSRSKTFDYYDAPVEVTLKSGLSFFAPRRTGVVSAQPAALRIEQLKSAGGTSVIQDNEAKVKAVALATTPDAVNIADLLKTPAPASSQAAPASPTALPSAVNPAVDVKPGFSCQGCANNSAPPLRQNADEGLTYALVFLGFLGYRRYKRR
ncbi:MAG: hypothetical protein JWM80_556 [Cyanobacteria bacterium RYN_339]|nr:hypothetical protein [Cyanobacteria bacterium RYN_339]